MKGAAESSRFAATTQHTAGCQAGVLGGHMSDSLVAIHLLSFVEHLEGRVALDLQPARHISRWYRGGATTWTSHLSTKGEGAWRRTGILPYANTRGRDHKPLHVRAVRTCASVQACLCCVQSTCAILIVGLSLTASPSSAHVGARVLQCPAHGRAN